LRYYDIEIITTKCPGQSNILY